MEEKKRYKKEKSEGKQMVTTSLILVLLALVSVAAATIAWFTIADRTKVKSMSMDITTGSNLRFDLDAHPEFEQYVKTLSFEQIAARIQKEKGFDMRTVPLEPVTTGDCSTFTWEDGTIVEATNGAYLEVMLHFMATEDMVVHLTSASSGQKNDGTAVSSKTPSLPESMRISFTIGNENCIYDPGLGDQSSTSALGRSFGLPSGNQMRYGSGNALFRLKKNTDQPVLMHIWLEGNDPACTDVLKGTDYAIRLRFVGTDENGNVLEGTGREEENRLPEATDKIDD